MASYKKISYSYSCREHSVYGYIGNIYLISLIKKQQDFKKSSCNFQLYFM